jgi:hypothetical protein
MTVSKMMSEMSAKEFQYWMVYYKVRDDMEQRAIDKAKRK